MRGAEGEVGQRDEGVVAGLLGRERLLVAQCGSVGRGVGLRILVAGGDGLGGVALDVEEEVGNLRVDGGLRLFSESDFSLGRDGGRLRRGGKDFTRCEVQRGIILARVGGQLRAVGRGGEEESLPVGFGLYIE